MAIGRPAKELVVSAEDRVQLESIARSQSLPAALVRRAQMILLMAYGETNTAVTRRFRVSRPTVTMWRTRYREAGMAGLPLRKLLEPMTECLMLGWRIWRMRQKFLVVPSDEGGHRVFDLKRRTDFPRRLKFRPYDLLKRADPVERSGPAAID